MLWSAEQLLPDTPLYNIPLAYRISGDLQVAALQTAVSTIVARHATLRTLFTSQDGEPVQHVLPEMPTVWSIIDFADLAKDARETTLAVCLDAEAKRPFDLAVGPLFRATLVKLTADEHVLMLTLHHIVADGWSLEILLRELAACYQQTLAGDSFDLVELPIQYKDYAVWEQKRHTDGSLDAHMAYWQKQFDGQLPLLELPLDKKRPSVQQHHGSVASFILDAELSAHVKTLSQKQGVSLFMMLLSVYKILLARYTRQEHMIIGSPTANRHQMALENLIGDFINMIPIQADLTEDPSFVELLQRTRRETVDAFAHEMLSFNQVIAQFAEQTQAGRTPIFQSTFVLQKGPLNLPLPGLQTTLVPQHSGTCKFDLTLEMWEEAGCIHGRFEYDTDLFELTTIQRMMGHYQVILQDVVDNPDGHISELALLTTAERTKVLETWNETAVSYPNTLCVHQLFEQQVKKTPDETAVIFEDFKLTYQQLNEKANQLAHYLQSLDVQPDQFVGICVERSLDMIVGLLGILKAGAAYLPMDPNYPEERLAYMLQDTQAAVLVTQAHLIKHLPTEGLQVVQIDADWQQIGANSTDNPESRTFPENLAYIIHTSGSTGKPKGVQIPHRAVVNFLETMRKTPGMTADDTLLAITTLSFDIAVLEMYLPITIGSQLVIASSEVTVDGPKMIRALADHDVTILQATPATWQMLLDAGWQGKANLKPCVVGRRCRASWVMNCWIVSVNCGTCMVQQKPPFGLLCGQ